MQLAEVLDTLGYSQSSYYLKTESKQESGVASLFRTARTTGVDGIYVIQSSSEENRTLPVRPVVFVASAQTPEEARISV